MVQQATLATAPGFEKHAKQTRRAEFLGRWKLWFRGGSCARRSSRSNRRRATAHRRWHWSGCYGCTFCSSGSTCRARRGAHTSSRLRCVILQASIFLSTDEDLSVGTPVWGDQPYQGQGAVLAEHAQQAEDRICQRWRSKLHFWPEQCEANRIHSKIRSRVEHVFAVLKLRLSFVKVRYRGLAKNLRRLHTSFALTNLNTAQELLAPSGQ